jgi:ribosomal protein S18 acetylase RimI-like enzyme
MRRGEGAANAAERLRATQIQRKEGCMPAISRLFGGEADLEQMQALVRVLAEEGARSYLQVGDLLWGMYQNTIFDPYQHMRLWRDEPGDLLAFAWFDPRPGSITWYLDPRRARDTALEEEILSWAEQHARDFAPVDEPEALLHAESFADDSVRADFLARHGFAATDDHAMLFMQRDLELPIPAATLPAGWTVRHVGGEDEYQERVNTHREVYHPSRVTLEAYRRLRTLAGYTPNLDLVAVSPEGQFGSYCICWHDLANQSGEYEPVGTRPAFRRLGLARAVLVEGFRRLRERGARIAIVCTNADNVAAVPLYESVGFRVVRRNVKYVKRLARAYCA